MRTYSITNKYVICRHRKKHCHETNEIINENDVCLYNIFDKKIYSLNSNYAIKFENEYGGNSKLMKFNDVNINNITIDKVLNYFN